MKTWLLQTTALDSKFSISVVSLLGKLNEDLNELNQPH